MPSLTLRPSHKAVLAYYESLDAFRTLGATHELAVKTAFATLLETAAKPFGWKLVSEHSMRGKGGRRIQPDGTLMDLFRLQHGHWEAKDSGDDLNKEIRAKNEALARLMDAGKLLFAKLESKSRQSEWLRVGVRVCLRDC
ncbi:MAG: hypothetical protein WCK55_06020 [Verrucomicrobiota bacterium]